MLNFRVIIPALAGTEKVSDTFEAIVYPQVKR